MDLKALQRKLLEQEAEFLASMPEDEWPAWLDIFKVEPSAVDQLAAIVDEDARRRLGGRRIRP